MNLVHKSVFFFFLQDPVMSDNITDGDRTLLNAKYFLLTGEVLKSISEQVIFWEGYCFRSRD